MGSAHVVEFGSHRHRKRHLESRFAQKKLRNKLQLLFICGSGFELTQFSRWLVEKPDLAYRYDVSIRPSFHSWKKEQAKAFAFLAKHQIPYRILDGNLDTEIKNCDFVLFESTSAAIQAILIGKIAIQIRVNDVIDTEFSPLSDNKKLFLQCQGPVDLAAVLDDLNGMSDRNWSAE